MKKEEKKRSDEKVTVNKKISNRRNESEKSKVVPKEEAVSEFAVRGRFLRISPRKIRLVANLIKGLSFDEAQVQLTFSPKRASVFLIKMLVNAEKTAAHNYKLEKEDLYIKNILVNQGPTLHRFKPAARGAAHPIRKRSSHIEIIISKRTEGLARDEKSQSKNKKVAKKIIPEIKPDKAVFKNSKKYKN